MTVFFYTEAIVIETYDFRVCLYGPYRCCSLSEMKIHDGVYICKNPYGTSMDDEFDDDELFESGSGTEGLDGDDADGVYKVTTAVVPETDVLGDSSIAMAVEMQRREEATTVVGKTGMLSGSVSRVNHWNISIIEQILQASWKNIHLQSVVNTVVLSLLTIICICVTVLLICRRRTCNRLRCKLCLPATTV